MLSQDNRLGHSVDVPVDIKVNDDGFVDALLTDKAIAYKSIVTAEVPLSDGTYITLTDYSSAGKL